MAQFTVITSNAADEEYGAWRVEAESLKAAIQQAYVDVCAWIEGQEHDEDEDPDDRVNNTEFVAVVEGWPTTYVQPFA